MSRPRTAAVLGLGLIGGSIARDLASAGWTVLGHDANRATLAAALADGVVAADLGVGLHGVAKAEWVILAVPVDGAPALLARIAAFLRNARLVTDVGSTKRTIVLAAERLGLGGCFVGSHPLAGGHSSGWRASSAGLFRGVPAFVTPTRTTEKGALAAVNELWSICGATVQVLEPDEHDARLAWSSHLPQIVSSALALTLDAAGLHRAELGPGGRDLTRLAASSPQLWTAIAVENADRIEPAMRRFVSCLEEFRTALAAGDPGAIQRLFESARDWAAEG